MDRERITELLELLPSIVDGRVRGREVSGPVRGLLSRGRTEWLHDPAFGWHLVSILRECGRGLPSLVREHWLSAAYDHLGGYPDWAVAEAASWNHEKSAGYLRGAVEAALLDMNAHIDVVAEATGLPADSIAAYEALFFNVLDRREERLYMARIAYPRGKTVEMADGYHLRESVANLARRGGYNNGMNDGLYILGVRECRPVMANALGEFEETIAREASFLVRNGMGHQSLNILSTAKAITTSSKIGGGGDEKMDDTGPSALGGAVVQAMIRNRQADQRLALKRQAQLGQG